MSNPGGSLMLPEEQAPHITQPQKEVMDQFMEFMADILDTQNDLTDQKYKKLSESADALYKSSIAYRQQKADQHVLERKKMRALANITIDALICKIVRDEPWDTLTPTKVRIKVAHQCGVGISPSMIDLDEIKQVMERETKLLVKAGRSDPAQHGVEKRRKR